jgi:hypothetical protein
MITGAGMGDFPYVGNFAKIRETFNWQKIKSLIEDEKGSFYKEKYETDVPLADNNTIFTSKHLTRKAIL